MAMLPNAVFNVYNIVTAKDELISYSPTDMTVALVCACLADLNQSLNVLIYVLASINLKKCKCFKRRANAAVHV